MCSSRPCAIPMAADPITTKPRDATPVNTARIGIEKITLTGHAIAAAPIKIAKATKTESLIA